MPTIESTIEFIKKAHEGQVDKAGRPYWEHPVRVMNKLPVAAYPGDDVRLAALLHDILEDTTYTKQDLLAMGYSEATVEIVELLTNRPGRNYLDKIRGIILSGNRGAILVKYADILDNTDSKRVALLSPLQQERLEKKYHEPLFLLMRAIREMG